MALSAKGGGLVSTFYEEVYALVRCVPAGQVTSYGRIARMLMSPRASRAVGYALKALLHKRHDPDYDDIPWQRVVNHEGYIRVARADQETGLPLQVALLQEEGVEVALVDGRYRVAMKAHLWEGLPPQEVEALIAPLYEEGEEEPGD